MKSEIVKTHFNELKIRDLDNHEGEKMLSITIMAVGKMLGVITEDSTIAILKPFLKDNFKDFSPKEIIKAFDLASAKVTDCDPTAYGILTRDQFGGVLAAYRVYRSKQIQEATRLGQMNNRTEPTPEELQQLNFNAMTKGVLQSFEYFKEHKEFEAKMDADLISHYHYDFLRAEGVIDKPNKQTVIDIKKSAQEILEVINKSKQESATTARGLKQINKAIESTPESDKALKIQNLAKKIFLKEYFESLILTEQELNELLNEK